MKHLALLSVASFCAGLTLVVSFLFWIWKVDQQWSPLLESRLRERMHISSIRILVRGETGEQQWMGSLTGGRLEERNFVPLSQVPPLLVQSIVVLEDPRFLEHRGFDVLGILRALLKNLIRHRYAQGGSTLTQQLVKNVFLSQEKTIRRKLTEIVLAALVEKRFTKDEILEAYFNEVYMGQLGPVELHGVARAAEFYFSKKVGELEVQEMALLAAMIAGPGVYSPTRNPERTKARRDKVLQALAEHQLILPEELAIALQKPLPSASRFIAPTKASFLLDAVREELLRTRGEDVLLKGGFDVELAVDLKLQKVAEKSLLELGSGKGPEWQGAIVAARPKDCAILAYVGGTDYHVTQLDRLRQSKRSMGSLVKPLLSANLLQNERDNLNLASLFVDQSLSWKYSKNSPAWEPQNYDQKFRGKVFFRQVLEDSLNVPFVRAFFERHPNGDLGEIFEGFRAWGLPIVEERELPSALIGVVEERPIDVLNAYLKFIRRAEGLAQDAGDLSCQPTFFQSSQTNIENGVHTESSSPSPAGEVNGYGAQGARLAIAAMEGALRRGTSKNLGSKIPQTAQWAGKTGTSGDLRDAWYVALSPDLAILGWVGRDDNEVTGLTGATGALPLVSRIVEAKIQSGQNTWSWPTVSALKWRLVDVEKACLIRSQEESKILGVNYSTPTTTPPPEVMESHGKKYKFELFYERSLPSECNY